MGSNLSGRTAIMPAYNGNVRKPTNGLLVEYLARGGHLTVAYILLVILAFICTGICTSPTHAGAFAAESVKTPFRTKRMSIRMGKSLDTEEPAAVAGSKLEPPYFLVKLVLGKASNAAEPAPAHSPFNLSRIEEVGRFFRGSMPVGTDLLNRYFIFRYVDHAGQDRWTIAHDERHTHRGSTGNLHFAPANDSHPAGGGRVTTPRPNPEKHASSTPRSVTPPEHDEHGDSPHALQHVAATAEEHVASPETL